MIGIVAECGAETLHGRVEAVLEIDERAIGPEPLLQLLARHDPAWTLEHHPQYFERLFLQPQAGRAVPQLPRAEVQLELPKTKRLIRVSQCVHGCWPDSPDKVRD